MSQQTVVRTVLLISAILIITQAQFVGGRPDALRCGYGADRGALFLASTINADGTSRYDQVYATEERSVLFNADGTFNSGKGHWGSRSACYGKSLSQLKDMGRAFYLSQKKMDS